MEKNTLSLWINWRIAYEFTIRTSSGCVTITTKVSSNLLTNCSKFAEKHGNSRYLNVLMSKEWCVYIVMLFDWLNIRYGLYFRFLLIREMYIHFMELLFPYQAITFARL